MQRVFFETCRYKEAPRKFMAKVNDNVIVDDIKKRIYELELGEWNFIFIAPKEATWDSGSFQDIKFS